MIRRTVIEAADLVAETLVSRRLRARFGRHLLNRASGDNECDMARNGEAALLDCVRQALAGELAVVFDIGANFGTWTAQLAPGLDRGSAIYAFEPVAPTFARLRENLARLAPAPRLIPVNAALGDLDGEVEMFLLGSESSGAHSLHERDLRAIGTVSLGRQPVRGYRGDTFCREHAIERIAFVKIDVEGHELAVLRGFASALEDARIGALQFEYGGAWIDARTYLKDAFALLQARGYVLGKLFPGGIVWHEHYDYALETFQYANFVAVRPEWKQHLRSAS